MGRGVKVRNRYGPYEDARHVGGVTYDGTVLWAACGDELRALDPDSGEEIRRLRVPAGAGTAFDGRHLYQVGAEQIQKIDPHTGEVVLSYPVPEGGVATGLTWAEGYLWLGRFRGGTILQLDAATGAVVRTINAPEFVTGVTWAEDGLWHAVDPPDQPPALRRIDAESGDVLESFELDAVPVTGLAAAQGRFYCGGGRDKQVRELVHDEG